MVLTRKVLENRLEVLIGDLRSAVEHLRVIEGAVQQVRWDLEQVDLPEPQYDPVADELRRD